jgi:hypothetical protein
MNQEENQADRAPNQVEGKGARTAANAFDEKTDLLRVKKKHATVMIPKRLLEDYNKVGGNSIFLTFLPSKDVHMTLVFTGFDGKNSMCVQDELEEVKEDTLTSFNQTLGVFSRDAGGTTLHNILSVEPVKDWYLRPVEYDRSGEFVSYELRDTLTDESMATALTYRLNPSPPA